MSLPRVDPGPCPACGAPHTACTASTGPITSVMLPARDARESVMVGIDLATEPDRTVTFSTATYRGGKKKP